MGIFSVLKRKPNAELILSKKEKIQERLFAIRKILSDNNHQGQARVIDNLLSLLLEENISEFIREIQSVNIWGGAGAVWEVWFESDNAQTAFATEMLGLIIILEQLKIATKSMRSIKKLFLKVY